MKNVAALLCVLALSVTVSIPAVAGTVTFRSAQFTAGKPVPHLHYEGPVVAGDLEWIAGALSQSVDCDPRTLPDTGGNCAVLTLNSEGGDYDEGLRIARFLRAQAIATWIEAGSTCHSACAVAFLGGSGQSSAPSIGAYVDRTIEPGATLAFHAPETTAASLGEMVHQPGLETVLGGDRDSIALLIRDLAGWNVEPRLLALISGMEGEQVYRAATAQDLHLLRTALPDAPRRLWAPDAAEALRNVCLRLLAHHLGIRPDEARDHLSGAIAYDLGTDDRGWELSGYRLGDMPGGSAIGHCATHSSDAPLDGNADIALFHEPGVGGHMRPALTFFHRPDGWSMLDVDGPAEGRLFQRGIIGHLFLPPETELGGALAHTWRIARDNIRRNSRADLHEQDKLE